MIQSLNRGYNMEYILNEGYDRLERATQANGKYITIDNRKLVDLSMGAGTHIFGHGTIAKMIKNSLNRGSLFTVPNNIADKCAELLHKVTLFNHFVFCNSGTEATMRAIRIARAYTGRDKIVFFDGYWHGTHDYGLTLYSTGIPQVIKDMVIVLPFTDDAFKRIKEKDIAIVMIEPIQSSLPINRGEFLKNLKDICTQTNTVLCFDEVISGFRVALGGAVEYLGVRPDLVTYGKIIGGGFPVGVIGGDSVMEVIPTGVRMGGTFSANPITMTACRKSLELLLSTPPYVRIHKVMQELQHIKTSSFSTMVVGNMGRLMFTSKTPKTIKERDEIELSVEKRKYMSLLLQQSGFYISSNPHLLFSTEHTLDDVDKLQTSLIHLSS